MTVVFKLPLSCDLHGASSTTDGSYSDSAGMLSSCSKRARPPGPYPTRTTVVALFLFFHSLLEHAVEFLKLRLCAGFASSPNGLACRAEDEVREPGLRGDLASSTLPQQLASPQPSLGSPRAPPCSAGCTLR